MATDYRHGIDWKAALRGLPADRQVHAEHDLGNPEDLEEVLVCFISDLDDGTFLAWEAAIRAEQGLPLSEAHREAQSGAVGSSDQAGADCRRLDERGRPREPWYETLRWIVSALLVETFQTAETESSVITAGWPTIAKALEEHGRHLSLPDGVTAAVDVIPEEQLHRLWLQSCFAPLTGIAHGSMTDDERLEAIFEFVDSLREREDHVRALGLTLEKLLELVSLPPRERKTFAEAVSKILDLTSNTDPIADRL